MEEEQNTQHPYLTKGITTTLKEQSKELKNIQNGRDKFTDAVFPPEQISLLNEDDKKAPTKSLTSKVKKILSKAVELVDIRNPDNNYKFKRLSELYNIRELNILDNKSQELNKDVLQGELGDCYLLSALSSLAENPNRIKKLFPNTQINSNGVFETIMYIHGQPVSVLLDDYVVVKEAINTVTEESQNNFEGQEDNENSQIAFAQINPETKSIWPLLIEKAWAKINSNYENTTSGNVSSAFEVLSPAPITTLYHNVHQDIGFDIIKQAIEKEFIVCCDITYTNDSKELLKLKALGLISNHAYNVIETAEVSDIKGEKIQLLRVKNSWGTNEWEGDWSDKSSKWTEEYKKLLNYEDKEDGIFWISYKDYLQFYTTTHICHERDNFNYETAKLSFNKAKPVNFFKIKVPKNTSGAIIVNQKNTRLYQNAKQFKDFDNNYGSMIVFKYENDSVTAVGCDSGKKNRMFVEIDNLEKGEYFVAINFPFSSEHPIKNDPSQGEDFNSHINDGFTVNVGVYTSEKNVEIDDIPEDDNDVKEFFIDYTKSHALSAKEEDKYYFVEEGEKDAFRVPYFDQKSAYGYIYYENNSDAYINELISFNELRNVSIMPLLRRGQLSSLKAAIENSEEPNETQQLNQLEKKLDVESKFTLVQDIKKGKEVSDKNPLIIKVTIAPHCSGTILLEKCEEETGVDFDSDILLSYPLSSIISDNVKFPATKTKIKYNNKAVDIYETVIEHNSGVLIKYKNKTKNLVFGSFLKFKELKNLKISINSDELIKEALKVQMKKIDEKEEDKDMLVEEAANIDVNDFNLEVKNPNTETALVCEPGEVKFVQLEAINVFEPITYSYDSTYMINLAKKNNN